jgi:hypothetical protein
MKNEIGHVARVGRSKMHTKYLVEKRQEKKRLGTCVCVMIT